MSGAKLILLERERQLNELNITQERDIECNEDYQLSYAASCLCKIHTFPSSPPPKDWSIVIWKKMLNKGYKERLVIAGALIAAEIDRMEAIVNKKY